MCGIAGFCNLTWDRKQVILKMNEKMIKRGPDAGGFFCDDANGMTIGHRRLSIVDLSENGAQPMLSHNERYVLSYNGEIYNAGIIKDKLIEEGYVTSFRGTSDTEIMLEAFCAYGVKETLQLCKGMFAIALYDKETKKITLSRDRVGEKPLYYGHVNGTFVFASDLSSIKAVPGFQNNISMEAVRDFLRYGYIGAPLSIYEEIYKCMPGHILTAAYPYDEFEDITYYDIKTEYRKAKENPFEGDFKEAVDGLEAVLKKAVKSQMMADVPLGAFLSGGIDSSVIVSLMQSLSSEQIKTFTIGFEEEQYNEAPQAEAIAKHIGTNHTSLIVKEQDLLDVVPRIPTIFSEPFADSSQIPTYLVSRLAKEKVTVSLSGDAGDELFCGYNTYWKVKALHDRLRKFPGGVQKAAAAILLHSPLCHNNNIYRSANCLLSKDIAGLHESVCYDTTYLADRLLLDKRREKQRQEMIIPKALFEKTASAEDEMMIRDMCSYHPDDILVKVDRAGMEVSLENRVPMLDKDVLQYAFSLPASYKCTKQNDVIISKYVLKEVLYRYVPKELMDRPKKGFSVPLTRWLTEGKIHEWAEELIRNSLLVTDGILDKKAMLDLWNSFMRKGINKGLLWNVIVLEQWYRSEKTGE